MKKNYKQLHHGPCGGLVANGGATHSSSLGTWRNIVLIGNSLEDLQVPFKNSFIKSIGDGGSTSFWHDHWISEDRLSNIYPRLYRLEKEKNALVKDRVSFVNGSRTYCWNWLRIPSNRTVSELGELRILLEAFQFNSWSWNHASNGTLTVKKLASLIDDQLLGHFGLSQKYLRNKLLPKKIEIFMWRLMHKRLPVRVELDKRGIDLHSLRCPLCDDGIESVDHLFFSCNQVVDIWTRVFNWWNLGCFSQNSLCNLMNEVGNSSNSDFGNQVLQASIRTGAYFVWKARNLKTFQAKHWSSPVVLNEIQIKSFEWISARVKDRKLEWLKWISNPNEYLKMK